MNVSKRVVEAYLYLFSTYLSRDYVFVRKYCPRDGIERKECEIYP